MANFIDIDIIIIAVIIRVNIVIIVIIFIISIIIIIIIINNNNNKCKLHNHHHHRRHYYHKCHYHNCQHTHLHFFNHWHYHHHYHYLQYHSHESNRKQHQGYLKLHCFKIKIANKFPDKITNSSLYNKCEEHPLSIYILENRWRLFGHILRRNIEIPANKSMNSYFATHGKKFRGRPLTTLPVVLNKDLSRLQENTLQLTTR